MYVNLNESFWPLEILKWRNPEFTECVSVFTCVIVLLTLTLVYVLRFTGGFKLHY